VESLCDFSLLLDVVDFSFRTFSTPLAILTTAISLLLEQIMIQTRTENSFDFLRPRTCLTIKIVVVVVDSLREVQGIIISYRTHHLYCILLIIMFLCSELLRARSSWDRQIQHCINVAELEGVRWRSLVLSGPLWDKTMHMKKAITPRAIAKLQSF
jgi:hypothetical protein